MTPEHMHKTIAKMFTDLSELTEREQNEFLEILQTDPAVGESERSLVESLIVQIRLRRTMPGLTAVH